MSKKQLYLCNACEAEHNKWTGKCESCGEWNSVQIIVEKKQNINNKKNIVPAEDLINIDINYSRYKTSYCEIDRIFGGGIVVGSAILIGGEPGIGKSTLLTQLSLNIQNSLYISAEESIDQISIRVRRIKKINKNVFFLSSTTLEEIIQTIEDNKINIIFLDSIQTIYSNQLNSTPGSIVQVKYCAHKIIELTKSKNITIVIISHVNKDGQIAGPKVLEHMVDTVMYFEGEMYNYYRILRTIKNRFGPANEIAVFSMTEDGLEEVKNPSSFFISNNMNTDKGSVIFAGIEGTRTIMLEIQALIAQTYMPSPRRAVVGWDINRLAMIIAIINTKCGIFLSDKEIYLNVAGGFKITETAADMAVAAALISASLNKKLPSKTIIFGEISLSGDIRNARHSDKRLQEASKLGFLNAIIPTNDQKTISIEKIKTINNIIKLKNYIENLE